MRSSLFSDLKSFTPKTSCLTEYPGCGVSCNRSQGQKNTPVHDAPSLSLLPHNLLDLADLLLYCAGHLFSGTFSFQLGIIA